MRWPLVFLLAAAAYAGDDSLAAARASMEAKVKEGDALRAKGDLEGAVAAYRDAVALFHAAVAEEGGPGGKEKAPAEPEPPPADDGTPEGRKRVIAYYVKLLTHETEDARYNATAQLGEMRAAEARDALVQVLEKDKYQVARRAAAWALGRLGKDGVPAIPALIREVGGEFPLLGHMCDDALKRIADAALGEQLQMGYRAEATAEERLEAQRKWQVWFDARRARLMPPEGEGARAAEPGREPLDPDEPGKEKPATPGAAEEPEKAGKPAPGAAENPANGTKKD
jgi:HEAT repeat protein